MARVSERINQTNNDESANLLPQIAGAVDLLLPSKLTNMLASSRPIVATAARGTGIAEEVSGCGLVVPPGNAERLAGAIERQLCELAA